MHLDIRGTAKWRNTNHRGRKCIKLSILLASTIVFLAAVTTGFYLIQSGFALSDDSQAMSSDSHAMAEPGHAVSQENINLPVSHTIHQDYTVCLKPNDFFPQSCQEPKRQYLSSLTDTINLEFGYEFTTDIELDYQYTYDLTGTLIVYDKEHKAKEIFTKEYKLQDPAPSQKNHTKTVKINDSHILDFQTYNQYATEFKKGNALSGDAVMVVQMNIDLTADYSGRSILRTIKLDFKIPLTKQTFNITTDKQLDEDGMLEFIATEVKPTKIYRMIAIIAGIATIIILLFLIIRHVCSAPKDPHARYDAKIHKEYGRIIVDLETSLETRAYARRYEVKSFHNLVDKADRTMQNILCSKNSSGQTFYAVAEGDNLFLYNCPPRNDKKGDAV